MKWLLRRSLKLLKEKKDNNKKHRVTKTSLEKEVFLPSRKDKLHLDKEMHFKQPIIFLDTANMWEISSINIKVFSPKVDSLIQLHQLTSILKVLL